MYLCLHRAYKSDNAAPDAHKKIPTPKKARPSLFEELFPEEKLTPALSQITREEKLPAFEWLDNLKTVPELPLVKRHGRKIWPGDASWSAGQLPEPSRTHRMRDTDGEEQREPGEQSVLVLNCASKTLEESDFFRLSPKGEHLEGWTSGIVKGTLHCYQRDPNLAKLSASQ